MAEQPGDRTEPGLGLRFVAEVDLSDGTKLGAWQKVEGLTVEYEIHEYKEGGLNEYIHRLPTRAKYQNVKLTRPVTPDSAKVAEWISQVSTTGARTQARISVKDAAGTEIVAWTLEGVFPARWSGPTLDVGQNQVAVETLELAHHGFLSTPAA
jgi:phage tail-like protein